MFHISIWGLKLCLGPKKVPRGDGAEFWAPVSQGGKLVDVCLIRIIAYSGSNIQKILSNWLCAKLDSSVLTPETTGKHSEKFLENAKNKNLLKIKRILNNEIQTNRGPFSYICPSRGGGAPPCPPSVTPLVLALPKCIFSEALLVCRLVLRSFQSMQAMLWKHNFSSSSTPDRCAFRSHTKTICRKT